jgi:hypothetical protein
MLRAVAPAGWAALDPKTHGIVRTISVGNPSTAAICGIAATRDALWVAVGDRYCENTGG